MISATSILDDIVITQRDEFLRLMGDGCSKHLRHKIIHQAEFIRGIFTCSIHLHPQLWASLLRTPELEGAFRASMIEVVSHLFDLFSE